MKVTSVVLVAIAAVTSAQVLPDLTTSDIEGDQRVSVHTNPAGPPQKEEDVPHYLRTLTRELKEFQNGGNEVRHSPACTL